MYDKVIGYIFIGITFVVVVLFFPSLAIGTVGALIAILGPFAIPVAIIVLIGCIATIIKLIIKIL